MYLIRLINKTLIVLIMIISLFFISGIAYSFFTAGLTGSETDETIKAEAGDMKIVYEGGANINVLNIEPSTEPFAEKIFTVTGNSTLSNRQMTYELSLVVEENTFSETAISYTLESINITGNGNTVPSMPERQSVSNQNINLGKGKFIGITNAVHSYNLKIYFYETFTNQSIDMRKTFKAYIHIQEGSDICSLITCLGDKILAQGGGASEIEAKEPPDFSLINGISGLYAAEDEYGTSYYYRGEKEELDNNLIFGGFQWKIIRINGDGSIRIIYNGTEQDFDNKKTINTTGPITQIGEHAWNLDYEMDAKYVGYMYGGVNGVASTQRNGIISSAATYNETSSNAKTILDSWYETNILGKSFENKIANNIFCNDRQLQSEVGGSGGNYGYGSFSNPYASRHRLNNNNIPTLKCPFKNDRFIVDNQIIGNGNLSYPVGLISADEASMAGMVYSGANSTNYLSSDKGYWTITPYNVDGSGLTHVCRVNSAGMLASNNVASVEGIRPVLNLDSDIGVSGDGSATNPFKVIN